MSKADRKSKKKRGGFIIGALIGGVIALLAAPRTGKETRQKLKESMGGGSFDFKEQADKLKDAVGAGKESAVDQSEALKRKIEETRARLREQMDEVE